MSGDLGREWLEADGLGGFASGTVAGPRTRKYHALLLTSEPDGSRYVLVNGVDVTLRTASGTWPLSTQIYAGGGPPADRARGLEQFQPEPWPCWTFAPSRRHAPDVRDPGPAWTSAGAAALAVAAGGGGGRDVARASVSVGPGLPLASSRKSGVSIRTGRRSAASGPYPGVPGLAIASNGRYRHDPHWYRRFHYPEDAARGQDSEEDLAAPGELQFDLVRGARRDAARARGRQRSGGRHRVCGRDDPRRRSAGGALVSPIRWRGPRMLTWLPAGRARARPSSPAIRGSPTGAGTPSSPFADCAWRPDGWMTPGRSCCAGRTRCPRACCPTVSRIGGASPNTTRWMPPCGSRWWPFEYLRAVGLDGKSADADRRRLVESIESILLGHVQGTRHHIGVQADGLLAAGQVGVQLTWMDAQVGDRVVTPRAGKPVEIQALWLNALWVAVQLDTPSAGRWQRAAGTGGASLSANGSGMKRVGACTTWSTSITGRAPSMPRSAPTRSWRSGACRARCWTGSARGRWSTPWRRSFTRRWDCGRWRRASLTTIPTFAAGCRSGTPPITRARRGPGCLAPSSKRGCGCTAMARRPGPRPGAGSCRRCARISSEAGVGHVSEVTDAEPPHLPGGCPFQAWSLGELLRLERSVLQPRR